MNIKLLFVISLCLLSWTHASKLTTTHGIRHYHRPSKLVNRQTSNYTTYYFTQPLNHHDKKSNKNKKTFQQRYWVNTKYYQPGGPAILFNPGEINAEPVSDYFDDLVFKLMGEKLKALVVIIEHRYYGESYPKDNDPQWEYLTVEQSLEDMANFIRHGNQLKGVPFDCSPKKIKWITRGGSYSGNLAAWMRYKYPDLVYAAVSSSSPVQSQFDFYQYYFPIMKYAPRQCIKALNNIVLKIDDFLAKHPEPSTENTKFKKQFLLDDESDPEFAFDAMSIGLNLWQDSFPQVNYFLDSVCPLFKNSSNPNVHFKNYAKWVKEEIEYENSNNNNNNNNGDNTNSTSTTKSKRSLIKRTNNKYDDAFPRQKCSQLGYWPSSPPKTHPLYPHRIMSNLITGDYWKRRCKKKYNITHNTISTTNRNFKGWNLHINRTIWIQGQWDPWRELSVLSDSIPVRRVNTTFEKYLTIPKGIHGYDYQIYDSVNYIHDYTIKTLTKWLK